MNDTAWDPDQYERFAAERQQPFFDLLDLLKPIASPRVVDLGCGTGEPTANLHGRLRARETLGIDNSPQMLARAGPHAGDGLRFELGDIARFEAQAEYDVVFSNAALHWVEDHAAVLRRWTAALRAGGQLAVQLPANFDHPSHVIADEVAAEQPFKQALGEAPPADPARWVLEPQQYATLLYELGFETPHVRLQVYGHRLSGTAQVVEWVKGTSLTRFRARLDEELWERYLRRYSQRLLETLGARAPYFYAFKRILFHGQLP